MTEQRCVKMLDTALFLSGWEGAVRMVQMSHYDTPSFLSLVLEIEHDGGNHAHIFGEGG